MDVGAAALAYLTELTHRRPRAWIPEVERLHALLQTHGDAALRALIVAGSYFVVDRVPGQAHSSAFRQSTREPGVQLRFAALICSVTESIFLKRVLILSSPTTAFLIWTVVCFAIAVIGAMSCDVMSEPK